MNKRIKIIQKKSKIPSKAIVYWISRDQRVNQNHALIYSQKIALEKKLPLIVIFLLQKEFLQATYRQYHFMIQGLIKIKEELNNKNIYFLVTFKKPIDFFPYLLKNHQISEVITDFSPLRIKKKWLADLSTLDIDITEVDTHNIVPYHQVSEKKEFAAFTIRKKINNLLPFYLKKEKEIINHPFKFNDKIPFNVIDKINDETFLRENLKINFKIRPSKIFLPGYDNAQSTLKKFIQDKLPFYFEKRNNLYPSFQSSLSAYLHFGQISSLEVALKVKESNVSDENKKAFLEEIIIRKELADNFCFYEENYDNFLGLPDWAKETLNKHKNDKREYLYNLEQLENGETHDKLWNACQLEMVKTGKMNGYLRMYWAKKILEWSTDPKEAIEKAVYLNDKYEIDGRDPNGYTGILWSIGGLHDRPFFERPIYGLVRMMSQKSIEKKYDVLSYINYVNRL